MFTLSDLAEIIARQFWRMVLVGGVCAGFAAWALLSAAPVYEARALLLFKLGREYVFVPDPADAGPGARAPEPGALREIVGAEMQIVANRDLRRRLLEEMGIERVFPGLAGQPDALEQGVDMLQSVVNVALIPNTLMVDLRVRHRDADLAAELTNRIVDLYLERRAEVFPVRDEASTRERLLAAQASVDATHAEIRDLLSGSDPLTFETERGILVARRGALQAQIADLSAEIAGLRVRRAAIEAEIAETPETVVDFRNLDRNPVLAAARGRLVTLEAQRDVTVASVGANHPSAVALTREIEALRARSAAEPEEVEVGGRIALHPIRLRAETELFDVRTALEERETRLARLEAELASNAAAIAAAARVMPELGALLRSAELQRDQIAQLDRQLRELALDARAGFTSGVRVLERAEAPRQDVGAPGVLLLALSLIFGGVIALGTGLLAHFARPTALTAGMLERRLGAPALAEIDRLPTNDRRALRFAS